MTTTQTNTDYRRGYDAAVREIDHQLGYQPEFHYGKSPAFMVGYADAFADAEIDGYLRMVTA